MRSPRILPTLLLLLLLAFISTVAIGGSIICPHLPDAGGLGIVHREAERAVQSRICPRSGIAGERRALVADERGERQRIRYRHRQWLLADSR